MAVPHSGARDIGDPFPVDLASAPRLRDVSVRPAEKPTVQVKPGVDQAPGTVGVKPAAEPARAPFTVDADRYRALVEGVSDYAILLLDREGYVRSWNAGAARIKGYTAEQIVGRHFTTFYPREAVERGWPDYELRV